MKGDEDCPEVHALPESRPHEVEEGAPLWTVTFGDMMSLLLTFFILMYSMSELKVERFLLASQSLNEAMGGTRPEPLDEPLGLMPDPVDPELALDSPGREVGAVEDAGVTEAEAEGDTEEAWVETFTDAYMEMIAKRLEAYVEENGLEESVRVERAGDGVYLRIETVALFASGEAVISPPGTEILNYLALITRELQVPVSVSGHADNVPISTPQFASNWELSAARAAGVARVLVGAGQDPTEVRVESYGEYRPVAGNDTPEGREQNRRVELFYDRDEIRDAARRWARDGVETGTPEAEVALRPHRENH